MRFALALLTFLIATPNIVVACGTSDQPRCDVADGHYLIAPPPGRADRTLPGLLIFIHGHRSSAAEMMNYTELADAAHAMNMVLVAPQGMNDTWSTPGAPSTNRDEVPFIRRVLDDLPNRVNFDPKRVVLSGFSQGASVVWHVACAGEPRIRAFMPIAGVWWRPMPETCAGAPVNLLHIHGTADPVMPMQGRRLRDTWHQGDVREAFSRMMRHDRCDAQRMTETKAGQLSCTAYTDCADATRISLCLHGGDHHTNPRWFADNRDWLDSVLR